MKKSTKKELGERVVELEEVCADRERLLGEMRQTLHRTCRDLTDAGDKIANLVTQNKDLKEVQLKFETWREATRSAYGHAMSFMTRRSPHDDDDDL